MNHTDASLQLATALRHGVIAAQARDFDRARPLLQHVTEKTPDDVIAWYWLAIASPSADSAIPCLRKVLAIDKEHALAREALSRLLIAEARNAAAAGRRDDARALATEATALTPENIATWRAVADLATSQVERIDALRRMVQFSPEDAGLRTQFRQALLARAVLIARTDRVEARVRFQEVAALNPSDVRIWQALCNLADTRDEQAKYLKELLRVAPDHQGARAALRRLIVEDARELHAVNRLRDARERWREAIDVAGSDVELWLGYAESCDDNTDKMRAIQAAQELDSHDPRVLEALAALNGHRIDPSELPAPDDAFARFDASPAAEPTAAGETVDDAMFDSLAQLPEGPPSPVNHATAAIEDDMILAVAREGAPDAASGVQPFEAPAPVAGEPPAPAAPEPAMTDAANGKATVMIVDDSPTIRKILSLTLEKEGYHVIAEKNGELALKRLEEIVPRVVLLDIAMPDLDGYEVCKRIKQDPRTSAVPVIMLSGKGAFFDKVKGHLAGANEYLTKPFETPDVLAVVGSHCNGVVEAHHG
jgi:twitching motility two-component system response regulator PilG